MNLVKWDPFKELEDVSIRLNQGRHAHVTLTKTDKVKPKAIDILVL